MLVHRSDRLNELIKRSLSVILQRESAREHFGLMTVSRVVVSKDMQHARVFFTALGGAAAEERVLKRLQHQKSHLRYCLAQAIHLRYTPVLIFAIDTELEEALRVDQLIGKLTRETPDHP